MNYELKKTNVIAREERTKQSQAQKAVTLSEVEGGMTKRQIITNYELRIKKNKRVNKQKEKQ